MPFWNRKKPKPETYKEIHDDFIKQRREIIEEWVRRRANMGENEPKLRGGDLPLDEYAQWLLEGSYNVRGRRLKDAGLSDPEKKERLLAYNHEVERKVWELRQKLEAEAEGPEHGEGHEPGGRK